ncbi:hypothetical protein ACTXT7_004543 [Hymenolepis weldensis]
MQKIVNNEYRLIDEVALMQAKTQKQHRNMLLAKLEEVRRLKEAELRKLAEAGYRKQATSNRVIYGSDMNKLYVQDLNAQIEMNNIIKEAVKLKEDSMPSGKSLPIGLDSEARSKKRINEIEEEMKLFLSTKELRKAMMIEQKLSEAKEMRKQVELYQKEKEEAQRKTFEKQINLRDMFEKQIVERQKELQRQKEQEANASSMLTANALKLYSTQLLKAQQIRIQSKQRSDEYLEYVKQMKKEKEIDEKIKEDAIKRIAEQIVEANDRNHKQQREASQVLEKEVREMQIKQMKEKESQAKQDSFISGTSFLDKIFDENDKEAEKFKRNEQMVARELKEQIRTRPVTVYSRDWGTEGRDFTRQYQQPPEGNYYSYEYLNPLRKSDLIKQDS